MVILADSFYTYLNMLDQTNLEKLYQQENKSMKDIAEIFRCSPHKVKYWMDRYAIPSRNHSEATYVKRNPNGDPFCFHPPATLEEAKLFGLGIGLYWGEGTKSNLNSVRLGNTDPLLIEHFIEFLVKFFGIKKEDLMFGLQLFTDIDISEALDFWVKKLNIERSQINKPVVTKSGSIGTYRKKSQYGVLTVMFHNKKLRDLLISLLPM